jgi:hypothetical protein
MHVVLDCRVVRSHATLLSLFDGDERRVILYLQYAMCPALRRPYDLMSSPLDERKLALDKIEKACRKTVGIYPAYHSRPTIPSPDTPTDSTSDSSPSSNPANTLLVVARRSTAKEG